MRNNKKRGFTLVELLVVIAILAILATVSVVGYTSFIERANISADEQIVDQLNTFLDAYKVNNPGDITEDNAWAVTQEILDLGGLDQINGLVPKASKYHFYFDINNQEFVHRKDDDLTHSVLMRLLGNIPGNATFGTNCVPGLFKDAEGNKYFLVDTSGSSLANVVRGFYTFDNVGEETDTSAQKFTKFMGLVDELDGKYQDLKTLAATSVIVTKEGNYVMDKDGDHKNLFVHPDATAIENVKREPNGDYADVTETKPLIQVTADTTISLVKGMKLPANSLNIDVNGNKVVVIIDAKGWDEVIDIVDANFTNPDVIVKFKGASTEYTVNKNTVTNKATGNEVASLIYLNPMYSFNIEILDNSDELHTITGENKGYIAFNTDEFTIQLADIIGIKQAENAEDTTPISTYDVEWSVNETYLEIVENNGSSIVVKFKTGADGLAMSDLIDLIEVKATAIINREGKNHEEFANCAGNEYELNVYRTTNFEVLVNNTIWGDTGNYLVYTGNSNNDTSTVAKGGSSYNKTENKSENTLNETFTLKSSDETILKVVDNSTIVTQKAGKVTLTVTVGECVNRQIEIEIFDETNMPVDVVKHSNIDYVGNSDKLYVGDFFDVNDIPAGAELRVFQYTGDNNYLSKRPKVDADNITRNDFAAKGDTDGFQFKTTVNGDYVGLAIYLNGVRISSDVKIRVVEGYNVRDIEDFTKLVNKNVNTYNVNGSVVLLGDVALNAEIDHFTVTSDNAIYGNLFTINLENAKNKAEGHGYGIIRLNGGAMYDTRVIGAIYDEVMVQGGTEWSANAVEMNAGAIIDNCYITNTRAPLIVRAIDGIATIKNTVLYGGRYANLDMRHGQLNVEGVVTTIQLPGTIEKTDDNGEVVKETTIGLGVVSWFEDDEKIINFVNGGKFKQFNFINNEIADSLPSLSYSGVPLLNFSDPFNYIFTREDTDGSLYYKDFLFNYDNGTADDTSDDVTYFNSGIVSLDRYRFDYRVEGIEPLAVEVIEAAQELKGLKFDFESLKKVKNFVDAMGDMLKGDAGNEKDDEITIVITPPSGITTFTITYPKDDATANTDSDKFNDVYGYYELGGGSDGVITITYDSTDGVWKTDTGVTLATNNAGEILVKLYCSNKAADINVTSIRNFAFCVTNYTSYDFQIVNESYKSLVIKNNGTTSTSATGYDPIDYKYDLTLQFTLVDNAEESINGTKGLLHTKGMHYNQLPVEAHTLKSTGTNAAANQALLTQYIGLVTNDSYKNYTLTHRTTTAE